jgi:hypothetical protein
MKTELQKALSKIAPYVSIRTIWEHDCDMTDIRKHCDGMDDEDPDGWQAWQSNVRALAIVGGKEIEGNAYLGGTWEKAGDVPEESNPEISGYEPQMTVEALRELGEQITDIMLASQIIDAIRHCEGIA